MAATINRARRRFHDPWGNKYGNRCGQLIGLQFLVGKSQLSSFYESASIDEDRYYVDGTRSINADRVAFVKAGKNTLEAMRR